MANQSNFKPIVTPAGQPIVYTTVKFSYDEPIPRSGPYGDFWSWGIDVNGVTKYFTINSDKVLEMLLEAGACKDCLMDIGMEEDGKKRYWKFQFNSGSMINEQTAKQVYANLIAKREAAKQGNGNGQAQAQAQAAPAQQPQRQAQPAQQSRPAQPPPPQQQQSYGANYNYPEMRKDNFEAMRLAREDYLAMYEDAIVEAFCMLERAGDRIDALDSTPKTTFKKLTIDQTWELFKMAGEKATGTMISTVRTAEMKHGGLWQISVPEGEISGPDDDGAPNVSESLDDIEDETEAEAQEPDLILEQAVDDLYKSAVTKAKNGGEAMSKLVVDIQQMFPSWFGHANHVKNIIKNKLGYTATPAGDEAWKSLITEIIIYERARQDGLSEGKACLAVHDETSRPIDLMPPAMAWTPESEEDEEEAEEEPLF